MGEVAPLTGELQTQVMAAVWRLEKATVEQVRSALPPRYRGAYNTIQTVLNRLADRKLLSRHKVGSAFEYRPLVSEIVVSAGALASLDDDELAAGLDHEAGHIARRHRFVMLLAVGLRAFGRAVPGTGRGLREIAFHLERDADRWALRHQNDRVALASVICKAAGTGRTGPPALAGLGDSDALERLGQVLDVGSGTRRRTAAAFKALATAAVMCTVLVAAVVPAAAVSGAGADAHHGHHRHHCEH